AGVGQVHRAVQDAHLRVAHRGPQAGGRQLGRGGKDQRGAVGNGLLDQLYVVFALLGAVVDGGGDLAGKYLVHLGAAKLVGVGPGAGGGAALVDKGHLEGGG